MTTTVGQFYRAATRAAVAALLTAGLVLAAQLWFALRAVDHLGAAHDVEQLSLSIGELAARHILVADRATMVTLEAALDDLDPALAQLRETGRVPEWRLHALESSRDRMRRTMRALHRAAEADLVAPDFSVRRRMRVLEDADSFLIEAGHLNETVRRITERGLDSARSALRSAVVVLLALGVVLWVLLFKLWRRVKLRLLDPLVEARDAIGRIGAGDLSTRVEARTPDELGRLFRAINAMARGLQRVTASRAELACEVARRAEAETTLKARNEKLTEINAELDRFAYIASHDLRAPLRGIRHLAEWILEEIGPEASDDAKRYHGLLAGRLERLDALLDSLLQFNRIGRTQFGLEDVDPARVTREIADLLDVGDRMPVVYEGDRPSLLTHRPPFELILRNLIANAIKHHDRETGRVVVSGEIVGENRIVFSVADDGPGVPPELQDRIFNMFTTLRSRDAVEGSGMGLAIIRKTARLYDSRIEIESPIEQGRGARFRFSWPIRLPVIREAPGAVPNLRRPAIELQRSDAAKRLNR